MYLIFYILSSAFRIRYMLPPWGGLDTPYALYIIHA
jgi:hypothetical protein